MPSKIISIVLLAILTLLSQSFVLADSKKPDNLFKHSQSMFCAETTDDENKEKEKSQEEEEPDCD